MTDEAAWYDSVRAGVVASAESVAPTILHEARLLGMPWPARVIDVGAGRHAAWATVFAALGCSATAIDLPTTPHFSTVHRIDADLTKKDEPLPIADLAVCFEVGEHLDERYADRLVSKLCAAAPIVAFTAAVPEQPGPGHVNCQWPEYWAEKFRARGRRCDDRIRWRIWDDTGVDFYYRQNMFIASPRGLDKPLRPVVHPAAYLLALRGWPLQEHPYPI